MSEMNTAITVDTVSETEQAPKVRKPRSDKGQSRKKAEQNVFAGLGVQAIKVEEGAAGPGETLGDPAVVALAQQAESLRTQLDKTERALAILRG